MKKPSRKKVRFTVSTMNVVGAVLLVPTMGNAAVPTFPGAQGARAGSVGGRGGRIIELTNLNNSEPGCLRECVEASGPRICVFKVAGEIQLKSSFYITNPYLTVAGQTAPSGGQGATNIQVLSV